MPHIDICWDISQGVPIPFNSMQGIYSGHCLEHVSLDVCKSVLTHFYRILKKGGKSRIIVPDAEIYMDSYAEHKREGFSEFPYVANEEVESGYEPMIAINRVFRNHSHLFVYDLETLQILLKQIGFVNIEKKIFMDGDDRYMVYENRVTLCRSGKSKSN